MANGPSSAVGGARNEDLGSQRGSLEVGWAPERFGWFFQMFFVCLFFEDKAYIYIYKLK
jgi:hypothetical protein